MGGRRGPSVIMKEKSLNYVNVIDVFEKVDFQNSTHWEFPLDFVVDSPGPDFVLVPPIEHKTCEWTADEAVARFERYISLKATECALAAAVNDNAYLGVASRQELSKRFVDHFGHDEIGLVEYDWGCPKLIAFNLQQKGKSFVTPFSKSWLPVEKQENKNDSRQPGQLLMPDSYVCSMSFGIAILENNSVAYGLIEEPKRNVSYE